MSRGFRKEKEETYSRRSVDVEVVEYANSDDMQLELLGYKSEFKRDFTFLGLFFLTSSELAVLPGVAGTIWCVCSMHERVVRFFDCSG